ncbi:thioredoxin family protein [Reichenbachiella sp. MSK19-1]|uniref:thioredoxin family protein n=1 Tax=Reichenbachiella sp. MSK19-1 TaxID=1897631 RepID=UPI000E6BDE0E|nr:thioredoxin family protein [Reichenbachiella sp. MSK19-1]RJE73886.1 hypothetical protein BGP76_11755 [Reichenbachiella sp. MSK19-1]
MFRQSLLITFQLLFVHSLTQAQTHWEASLVSAQQKAIEEQKLIIIDIDAEWCKPCKVMNKELWESEDMKAYSYQFIFVRLDFEKDRGLTNRVGVSALPSVLVTDPIGNTIWSQQGYRGKAHYLSIFKALPPYKVPIKQLLIGNNNQLDIEGWKTIANLYQTLALSSSHEEIRLGLLKISSAYYEEIDKKTDDDVNIKTQLILNEAMEGNHKRSLKKIERLAPPESETVHFIYALCHLHLGNQQAYSEHVEKVISDKYLSILFN